ncbi:MAG: hypothetical protein ACSLE9_07865 [Burkholderiaceae bacterium]
MQWTIDGGSRRAPAPSGAGLLRIITVGNGYNLEILENGRDPARDWRPIIRVGDLAAAEHWAATQ